MRKFMMTAACTVCLSLSACSETSETYAVPVGDVWSSVASHGDAAGSFGLPNGLESADVDSSFEAAPGDRTAHWTFNRNGKELARINAVVEGDETSSTIRYSYVKGEVSDEDKKAEQVVRQFSQMLIVEAMDAKLESREPDGNMRMVANAKSGTAMMGDMMKGANAAMDEAVRESN